MSKESESRTHTARQREEAAPAPFVSLSNGGLRLHLPHQGGFAVIDLSADNAIKLIAAVGEKLTKLKGQGVLLEIAAWLTK